MEPEFIAGQHGVLVGSDSERGPKGHIQGNDGPKILTSKRFYIKPETLGRLSDVGAWKHQKKVL